MNEILKCDFCETNDSIGVYATDHGPFSLSYCEECFKHYNLRTIGNALSKWGRFGDDAFEEYKEINGCEPQVYFNNNYISLRNLVEIIDISDVDKIFSDIDFLRNLIIDRLNEKHNKRNIKF
jgi:hypothetical protein